MGGTSRPTARQTTHRDDPAVVMYHLATHAAVVVLVTDGHAPASVAQLFRDQDFLVSILEALPVHGLTARGLLVFEGARKIHRPASFAGSTARSVRRIPVPRRHCQVEVAGGRVGRCRANPRAITDTDSRPRSSVTPSGSIIVSVSAFATRRTSWPNGGSWSPTKRFGNGVGRSVPPMLERSGAGAVGWATPGIWTSCSSTSRSRQYLWRAVDEDGDVIDILGAVATQSASGHTILPQVVEGARLRTPSADHDKLRSYPAACRSVMPSVVHVTDHYANNRAEVSHQPTRPAGSARCGASSRLPTSNASHLCMGSCRISSGWADICSGRLTTGYCERGRSSFGMR